MPRRIKAKWTYNDFLYMHMQKMDIKKIDTFLTDEELVNAEKVLNDDTHRKYFNSKLLFYERFGSFMKREIISLLDVTEKYMMAFIKKHTFSCFGWYRIGLGILVLILGACGIIGGAAPV